MGVRVNAVAPGPIATERQQEFADHVAPALARIPSRRMSTPEEVAAAVVFLASDDASNIHGAVLSVDGGLGSGLPCLDFVAFDLRMTRPAVILASCSAAIVPVMPRTAGHVFHPGDRRDHDGGECLALLTPIPAAGCRTRTWCVAIGLAATSPLVG